MFGMALKFFELNLQPLNVLKNSDASNRQSLDFTPPTQTAKKTTKSSQNIKAYDFIEDKENMPIDQLKQSRIRNQNTPEINIEELKLSQQKILQDFKNSISNSLAIQNHLDSDQNQESSNQNDGYYDRVGGLVLSKIQQLSEEYLEYSIRKEEFANKLSKFSGGSEIIENKNKAQSCDLIKSIIKSVLLEGPQEKGPTLSHSSLKKSNHQNQHASQNYQTHQSNERTSEMNETVTGFIKDLFYSLGLISNSQMQSDSLSQLTTSAKKNFNQLKGDDYVQKLNQMLQSVDNIDKQANPLGLSSSMKYSHLYRQQTQSKDIKESKGCDEKMNKSRKEILIKKEQEKKVKLVSPETFSQLEAKRFTIENQISTAIQFLTKTRRARKFAFGSLGITQVYINFSLDFKFMSYKQVENKFFSHSNLKKIVKDFCSCTKPSFTELEQKDEEKMTMLSLPWNLVNVSKGIKTRNFIKHEEVISNQDKGQKLHAERCLSLLFKNRTYDFEFESEEVRDEYFRSIKMMIKSSFEL